MEIETIKRIHVTGGFKSRDQVEDYLPANYGVERELADGTLLVEGVDNAGWTAQEYVIPRLRSGLIAAKEIGVLETVTLLAQSDAEQESKATSKFAITKVIVQRAEGPTDLCVRKEFSTLKDAQRHIDKYTYSYPKLGYDKHDIGVHWENGDQFVFRLDVVHPDNEFWKPNRNSIAQDIYDSWTYYAGEGGEQLGLNAKERQVYKDWLAILALSDRPAEVAAQDVAEEFIRQHVSVVNVGDKK